MLQVAPLFFDRVEQSGNRQMRLLHIERDHAVIFADRLDAGQTAPGFQRRTVRISTYGKLDNVMSTETLDQVGRRALGNNLAVVYDRQPIAHFPLVLAPAVAQNRDFARGGLQQPFEDLDGCGLPCTVGTEESETFSGLDLKVEPTHCFHFAVVGLAQVAALDSEGHRLILTDVASSSFLANQLWTAFSRVADGNESSSTLVRCCRATCPRRENPVKIPHRLTSARHLCFPCAS